YTTPEQLESVKNDLQQAEVPVIHAEIIKESSQPVSITPEATAEVEKLIAALEDDEDVTAVHTNIL
ncbi:MAG: YebC/PmpR family DNA-binding transcriptional regulator, partial [bacterium]|nr:YebC/PmpR family DNA-binding transcriptional regulator [bacterium]